MDAISRTQTEVRLVYRGFIVFWCSVLYMIHIMNFPHRDVSAGALVGLCAVSASSIVVGLAMRRRFLKLYTESLPHDPRKSSQFWRAANIISLTCAMTAAYCGAVLKYLGSSWLVPGILLGLSLGFLLLWRPRQLAVSGVQPT